jgi:hypothetical protein
MVKIPATTNQKIPAHEEPGEPATVEHVHEKEDDQCCLAGHDRQGRNGIPRPEIEVDDPSRDQAQAEEDGP